jgi:hypothetical protein
MPFAQYAGGGNRRGFSRFSTKPQQQEDEKYDVGGVNRQIDNAITRIRDAGYDISAADDRNWFEKATNLPEDQNGFFDVLELLGRGGNAVKNVIDKTLINEDQDALTAFWRGISGQDKVDATDFAERLGIENGVLKAITGLGIDLATDPLTYIPGVAFAKAGSAVGNTARTAARAGLGVIERRSPGFARFRQNVAQPMYERTRDALGRAFVPDYKLGEDLYGRADDTILNAKQATENRMAFMNEEAMKNVSDVANKAGGIDTGADVGRLMEKNLRQFEDVQMYEFPDGVRRTENKADLLDEAAQGRERIKQTGKELRTDNKQYQEAIGEFSKAIDDTNREINRLFSNVERQAGKALDAEKRADLRDATKQLRRVESQINGYPQAETALLRQYKRQVREAHELRFDILKQIRQVAPNGVRAVDGFEIPDKLAGYIRLTGKPIDEVANELGYQYTDDLLQELNALNGIPRKLTNDEVETLARREMERSGAMNDLQAMQDELQGARSTLQQLVQDLTAHAPDVEGKAFADLAVNPQWQALEAQRKALKEQFDAIRGEAKGAKQAKLAEIKAIEKEIEALREAARNPVMVQREIPRPEREYSQDPAVNAAAKNLMRSNAELRQWALDNGVTVGELEGYMKHILSREERARRKIQRSMPIDRGNAGTGQPNKKVINERTVAGSAEDVNERIGRDFFEPNAYFSTAVGQKQLIEYVNAASFRRQVLSNPNFAIKYEKGMQIPENAVVIDTNNYKFLPDDMGELAQEIGGEYVVTKSVKQALDRYKRLTDDEGINGFLQAYDKVQSGWKRMALFSPLYHLRNDVGAKFNNWVGGMSLPNVVKYSGQADKEVYDAIVRGNETAMFREFREQGLGSTGLSAIEFARRGQEPEDAIRKTIEKRSKLDGTLGGRVKAELSDLKNPLNAFETSRQFGDFVDQTNRFALYKWAREAKGMTPEQAAKKVREVQFDYSRQTPFEREVASRLMPFYRWMRNNLTFQIRSFLNDPRKYVTVDKLRKNAQDAVGIDEENVPDWMKESFAIPVYGENGNGKFVGLNLPLGDLAKGTEPGRMLFDAVTPLAKLPAELVMNRNFFYDKPIKKFDGQEKQYQLPFDGPEFGVDATLAYLLEQTTGQIGRGLSGYLQKPEEVDQDTKFRMPSLGISSLLKDFDANASEYFQQRSKLQDLLDLINYIEQQEGTRPRSIREIQAGAR